MENFQINFLKEILKNNVSFAEFTDFVIGEILPNINVQEGTNEITHYVLNKIQNKYSGKLVAFDIIQEEILAGNFVETCVRIIKNDRSNPDFDGYDTSDYEEVDFGEELKNYIKSGQFKDAYEDWFEANSFVNIQL